MARRTAIRKKMLLAAAGIYLTGFIAGVLINSYNHPLADELHHVIVERMQSDFQGIQGASRIFSKILIHNLSICVLMAFGGIVFGVPPAFVLLVNGLPLGVVLARSEKPIVAFLTAILPHGAFELPATFLAGSFGFLLGSDAFLVIWYWMKGEGEAPTRILVSDLRKVLTSFLLVLVLLAIAAVVETFLFLLYGMGS